MTSSNSTDIAAVPAADGVRNAISAAYSLDTQQVTRLGGEFDANYAVVDTVGNRWIAKIADANSDLDHLQWQHHIMRVLASPEVGLPVPSILRTRDDTDFSIQVIEGKSTVLRVYSWCDGDLMTRIPRHSHVQLKAWGRAAATIVIALGAETQPEGIVVAHDWDVSRAPEIIAASLPSITDAHQRRCVDAVLDLYSRRVTPRLAELPRSVVHSDLNDFNILAIDSDQVTSAITGVIDFGDLLETITVAELGTACAYAMLRHEDPLAALGSVVEGYVSTAPLSLVEIDSVYALAVARLALNAVNWTARSLIAVDPSYGLERSAHTWRFLDRALSIPEDDAQQTVRRAAGVPQ